MRGAGLRVVGPFPGNQLHPEALAGPPPAIVAKWHTPFRSSTPARPACVEGPRAASWRARASPALRYCAPRSGFARHIGWCRLRPHQAFFVGSRGVLRASPGAFPPVPRIAPRRRVGARRPRPGLGSLFIVAKFRPRSCPLCGGVARSGAGVAAAVGRGPPPRPPLGVGPPPLPLVPRSRWSRPPLALRASVATLPRESGVPPSAGRFVALRAVGASRSMRPAECGACVTIAPARLPSPRGSPCPCGALS